MAINFVWNFCNDRQKDAIRFGRKWLSGFDLNGLTAGSSKELAIHSGSINAVCEQYATSRCQKKKPYLRYRSKKSLGWVPVKGRDIKRNGDSFRFAGNTFRVFLSRELPIGKIKDGTNFSRDSRGNWFFNIVLEVEDAPAKVRQIQSGVGVDLGLKEFASLSDGVKIDSQNFFRKSEVALAVAQKGKKRRQVVAIHAKVRNQRRDFHHKLSHYLVNRFDYIAVGNINAGALAKTTMSKSVLDSGWSAFRKMLTYKAIKHGVVYEEVDESFTSQTCSDCGALPDSRPKGIAGLGIREWICSDCGAIHDRDVNAALNILRRGRATLAVGDSANLAE